MLIILRQVLAQVGNANRYISRSSSDMKIYNTLTRRIEEIIPIQAGKIKMYSCGPTVYRYIHIGNLRTFTMADWLRRAFEYRGFEVLHVKNINDVGHMRQ